MKITIFLDGRAGHEKQSMAIVHALQDLVDVEFEEIRINPSLPLQRFLDTVCLVFLPGSWFKYQLDGTDIVLGTGTSTHAYLLAAKKKYSIPAVTCMDPYPILRKKFDLCFVPRHDGIVGKNNIFVTDGPPVLPAPSTPRKPNGGLILIGGEDNKSHYWDSSEIISNIEWVAKSDPEVTWRVSSSPRTPGKFVELVKHLQETYENIVFFDFHDTPRGWVEEQYAWATQVWVTADSMSMIYESLTAGCAVGIFPVRWKKENNKFQASIDYLAERKLVTYFRAGDKSTMLKSGAETFDEAKRCAVEILKRLFGGTPNTKNNDIC